MKKRMLSCLIACLTASSLMSCSLFHREEDDFDSVAEPAESVSETTTQQKDEIGEIRFTPTEETHIAQSENAVMYADNEVLIVVKEGTDRAAVQQLAARYDAEIVGMIELTGDYQLQMSEAHTLDELEQIVSQLRAEEIVISADLDYITVSSGDRYSYGEDAEWSAGLENDADDAGVSWGFEAIEAPEAWRLLQENENKIKPVRLGLIDDGFDTRHEDLKACFAKTLYNTSPMEHGTHVAGTMAANADNANGICDVYPFGKGNLYGVSTEGVGAYSANGSLLNNAMSLKIAYAELIVRNVKVINSSTGFNYILPENWNGHIVSNSGEEWEKRKKFIDDQAHILADFLERLYEKNYDFVLVNSAGNDSDRNNGIIYDAKYNWWTCAIPKEEYPDLYNRIIVVGSIDQAFQTSSFSNGGERVDIYAPGEYIYSTAHGGYENQYIENDYIRVWSGTSMAAPHVAGTAALVWAANNALTGAEVKEIICQTANTDAITALSSGEGGNLRYDLVDAEQAVAKALNVDASPTTPEQNNGSILCWVVEKGTDAKLTDATITAKSADTNEIIGETTTDSDGHFELILPEGRYILTVTTSSGRYETYTSEVIEVKNQTVNYLEDWIKLTRKTVDLSSYLGTDIDAFLAAHPELQKVDTSDGTLEYQGAGIIVSAKPTNRLIDFIQIRENLDYNLYGLSCGTPYSEADQHITQNIISVSDKTETYRYIKLGNQTDISFHADAEGLIYTINVFGNYPDPAPSGATNTSDTYKESYKSLITKLSSDSSISTIDFALYDMNADGIPELILKTGTCEADYIISFYTYDSSSGSKKVGDGFSGFHSTYYVDKSTNSFCSIWGQMGVGGIEWYRFDGERVSKNRSQNNVEYDTPNVHYDNYEDAYNLYGDFEDLDTTYCFLALNEGWVSSYNGKEAVGIDFSLIDHY